MAAAFNISVRGCADANPKRQRGRSTESLQAALSTRWTLTLVALTVMSSIAPSSLAAPRITGMSVRGLQVGHTTRLVLQGSALLPAPRLIADVNIAKQVVLSGATATRVELDVTLNDKVEPGLYNLRVATDEGISPGTIIACDRLPQIPIAEHVARLPVAVHGSVTGSKVLATTFSGKAGQQVQLEVESQRLAGKLRPVIHVYDARRRELAQALPAPWLSGDARLVVRLPADGEYRVELHDLHYAAPQPAHFRLKIGHFDFADMTFPLAVSAGKPTTVELLGSSGPGRRIELTPERPGVLPAPWPQGTLATGARPRLVVSSLRELVEDAPGKAPQSLGSEPVAVSGRLEAAGQEDVYGVDVTAGTKLRFEVFAQRIGSPIDAVLELRNDKGARLATNDDAGGTADSRLDYTVAKGITKIKVAVRDQVQHGGPRAVYRLVIQSVDRRQRGFELAVSEDTHNVPAGASRTFRVVARRNGYDGPIQLRWAHLPASFDATTVQIPPGADSALMTLRAIGTAPGEAITSIRGSSVGINPPLTAAARIATHPLAALQPWMNDKLAIALTPPNKTAFRIGWADAPGLSPFAIGMKFAARVALRRPAGAIGPIRLSLVSGPPPVLTNGKPDNNRTLRGEKAIVDVPLNPAAKAKRDALAAAVKQLDLANRDAANTQKSQATAVKAAAAAVKSLAAERDPLVALVAKLKDREVPAAEQKLAAAVAARDAAKKLVAESDEAGKPDAEAALKTAIEQEATAGAELAAVRTRLSQTDKQLGQATQKLTAGQGAAKAAVTAQKQANAAAAKAVQAAESKRAAAQQANRAAENAIPREAVYSILVPATLRSSVCDIAVKAELRSLDNKTVLAVAYTPVRRFSPTLPLEVVLDQTAHDSQLAAKTGATVSLNGKVVRKAGFAGNVTVTVTGLPTGAAAPKVVLKPGQSEFKLAVKLPSTTPVGSLTPWTVEASGPPDPKQAKTIVKAARKVSVRIVTMKPPATTPKTGEGSK